MQDLRFKGIMNRYEKITGPIKMPEEQVIEQQPQMQTQEELAQQQAYAMQESQGGQVQENPFNDPRYGSVNMPDQPIQHGGGMVEKLLNDDVVPDEIKAKHWQVFHPDNTLGFLDEQRKRSKLLNFEISKIDTLNCTPYYEYKLEIHKI